MTLLALYRPVVGCLHDFLRSVARCSLRLVNLTASALFASAVCFAQSLDLRPRLRAVSPSPRLLCCLCSVDLDATGRQLADGDAAIGRRNPRSWYACFLEFYWSRVLSRAIGIVIYLMPGTKRFLFVCENVLAGAIPTEIGQLAQLVRLDLDNNQLTGAPKTHLIAILVHESTVMLL